MLPTIRFHHLRTMGRSAAHCKQLLDAGDAPGTAAMQLGTATHAIVFETRPVIGYPARRAGKEWEAFRAANEASHILTADDYEAAYGMADAVRANPEARAVLNGTRERTIIFDQLGIPCRSTPDVFSDTFVTELKTTADASPRRFPWHALKMCYHAQVAFQIAAVRQSGLGKPDRAFIVAVESSAPYAVTVLRLTDRALEAGERIFRLWLESLKVCIESDRWPAYSDAIVDLDVPEDDVELTFGAEKEVPF